MISRHACTAVLLLVLFLPTPAAAQEALKESDMPVWETLLQAQIQQAEHTLNLMRGSYQGKRLRDEFLRERAGFQAGSIEVLSWIEARSRKVPVPPGARYLPGCSRYLTRIQTRILPNDEMLRAVLSDRPAPLPAAAVFTFDMPAGGFTDYLLDNPNATERDVLNQPMGPVSAEANATVQRAKAFFQRNGFTDELHTNNFARDGLHIWLFRDAVLTGNGLSTKLLASTEGRDLDPDSPEARECTSMRTGPLFWVVLWALPGEHPQSHWDAAVARAGWEDDPNGWLFLQSSIDMARNDIEDPEFSGLREMERLVAENQDEMDRAQLATRKRNMELYRRHAARFTPHYAELDRLSGEIYRVGR